MALDRAIREADLKVARTPLWWRLVHLVQWLLLLSVVAAGLYAGARELEPRYTLPFELPVFEDIEGIPLAAIVAGGSLAAGLLLGVVSRFLTRISARRKAKRVNAALRGSISQVAEEQVLQPVERVLADYAIYRKGLLAAQA